MLSMRKMVFAFLLMAAMAAKAQMAQEVLLLVNAQSQPSLKVGNTFAAFRSIPKRNIVYLDLPESAYGGTATITPEEFTRLIWEPAQEVIKERGLEDQILAWVYSVDFPIRIKTDPSDRKQMSLLGLTFVRNKMPALDLVKDGKYFSKLFVGPNERLRRALPAISLHVRKSGVEQSIPLPKGGELLRKGLGDNMPLPCMMLGYTGEKGNSVETVINCLNLGAKSDGLRLRRPIYFITSDDVRSTCRAWEFAPTAQELLHFGMQPIITTNFPTGAKQVMGVMMGAEKVDPSKIGSFAPGAMAEHLTSWGAEFQKPQTKITDWIKAGATATAGTVVEPFSNPNKFVNARYFVHCVSGATILESFYQSIACPLQSLLLGDPLARPYAFLPEVSVLGPEKLDRDVTYLIKAELKAMPTATFSYAFMLDGKMVQDWSDDPSFFLRLSRTSDGYHEIRGLARIHATITYSGFETKSIFINRLGRSISINPDIKKIAAHEYEIHVSLEGLEEPKKIRLISGEQILDERDYTPDTALVLDELKIGEGPNRVQAIAVYDDGMEVASVPLNFSIIFNPADN